MSNFTTLLILSDIMLQIISKYVSSTFLILKYFMCRMFCQYGFGTDDDGHSIYKWQTSPKESKTAYKFRYQPL